MYIYILQHVLKIQFYFINGETYKICVKETKEGIHI